MKKLSFLATTLLFALAMIFSVNVTYAYTSSDELFDNVSFTSDQDGFYMTSDEVVFNTNSLYQLDFDIPTLEGTYEVNITRIDYSYYNISDPSVIGSGTASGVSVNTISIGDLSSCEEDLFHFKISIYVDDEMSMQANYWPTISADVYSYVNLTSIVVDEVPPVYSYTNFEVDTPYHDLVTEAEIRAQLTATDPEEGDVTSRIAVYNDVYTSEVKTVGGNYYIMYVVDDTAGNSAYLQVDINVIDDRKPSSTYNSTTYQDGSSLSLSWFDDDNATAQLTLSEIQALFTFDDEYYSPGFLTVNTTCAGYSQTTPGNYAVNMAVSDPSGNTADITINVTVMTNDDPVISGSSSIDVEVTDVNITEIIALFTASDTEDGSLSVVVDSTNTWDYGNPVLGSFTLVLSATDSLGAETLKSVAINVEDTTPGAFKIDNISVSTYTHNVNMSDTATLQDLIDSIICIDTNYGDITTSINVPTLPNLTVPGSTDMTLTCVDDSGNTATLVLTVNVIDDIVPVINGASKIVKGLTATLTLSDITAELSSTDNVDGIIAVEVVTDGYTGNSGNLGSYVVQYKATDSSGNIAYHDVRVWVVDNQVPVWILNDFFVNITENQVMDRTELVSLLQASGMIGGDISYTVTFITDEYSGNESIEGAYEVVMNVTYEDGSEDTISVQLNVPDVEDDSDVIVVTPDEPLTGLQKTIQWVKTATSNIGNFFESIWNGIKTGAVWTYDHLLKPVWDFIFVKDNPDDIPVYTTDPTGTTTTAPPATELPVVSTETPYNQV